MIKDESEWNNRQRIKCIFTWTWTWTQRKQAHKCSCNGCWNCPKLIIMAKKIKTNFKMIFSPFYSISTRLTTIRKCVCVCVFLMVWMKYAVSGYLEKSFIALLCHVFASSIHTLRKFKCAWWELNLNCIIISTELNIMLHYKLSKSFGLCRCVLCDT